MDDLRERVARRLCQTAGDEWQLGRKLWLSEADAIHAMYVAYMTSDEAVERALDEFTRPRVGSLRTGAMRAAILAALGDDA